MIATRYLSVGLLALTLGGCATGGTTGARPQDITTLEQRAAAAPGDVDAATALGVAYFNAGRFEDARRVLAAPAATNATAVLYLGLANEELKDWAAARQAYDRYLATATPSDMTERIKDRIPLVAREQFKAEAKVVIEREQQLSTEPPTPRTVAVMPFRVSGTNEDLEPLRTALSDMIITDLSVSPSITAVERVKIGAMIDEMVLAQSGLAEESSGARVGHLLKAEHVVQGVLAQTGEKEIRVDGTILNTARRASAGTFADAKQMEAIFDLEKQIVFNIFNVVGVTLTAAEREKINDNRTANLLAFLAYGRGLEEKDDGNYRDAAAYFRQAVQLDPNFGPAQVQEAEAISLQNATETTPTEVAGGGDDAGDLLNDIKNETVPSPVTLTIQTTSEYPGSTFQQQNQTGNINTAIGNPGGVAQAPKTTITITIIRP